MASKDDEQVFPADSLGVIFKPDEFVLDFAKTFPRLSRRDGSQEVESIHNTILTDPRRAKRFLQVLQKNIEKYEEKYGEIELEKEEEEPGTETDQDYIA